jgi:hypothetical protein
MNPNIIKTILEGAGLDDDRVRTLTQRIVAETEKQIAEFSADLPTQILVRGSGSATIPKGTVEALGASAGDLLSLAIKTPRRSRKNPEAQQNPSLIVQKAAASTREPEEQEEDPGDSVPESVGQLLNGRQAVPV